MSLLFFYAHNIGVSARKTDFDALLNIFCAEILKNGAEAHEFGARTWLALAEK